MKKLLLIIPLLFGCAREWECTLHTIDDSGPDIRYLNYFHSDGSQRTLIITEDWPYGGEDEAKERCENSDVKGIPDLYCMCERRDK